MGHMGYVLVLMVVVSANASDIISSCRLRSNLIRQDGGLCFELPPWHSQPVQLEEHIQELKQRWGNISNDSNQRRFKIALVNSEISKYMDTVISPFLDTYHRNIQVSYQHLAGKILKSMTKETNAAVIKKKVVYSELSAVGDKLNLPATCDEERREIRTLASKHVAQLYACTEQARASIAKMGKYAEEMISITKKHMQATLKQTANILEKSVRPIQSNKVKARLIDLARASVALGYELDLSLTNARRHNEQSCERLSFCSELATTNTDAAKKALTEKMYQCVYA